MKKLLVFVVMVGLVLGLNMVARAEYKKVYFEYKKEEDIDDFGPKIGLNWEINDYWSLFASYERNGDEEDDSYIEAQYRFLKNYNLGMIYETVTSEDSYGVYLGADYSSRNRLWLNGRISYTLNNPQGYKAANPDYSELKFSGRMKYQLSKKWASISNCYWTITDVEQDGSTNYDSKELEIATGLEYLLSNNFRVSGSYDWVKTTYDQGSVDDERGDTEVKYIIGLIYTVDKCDIYLWHDLPNEDNTTTLGVSYSF